MKAKKTMNLLSRPSPLSSSSMNLSWARYAQSMNELVVIVAATVITLFAIGTMLHRAITADVKSKVGDAIENPTSTLVKNSEPEVLPTVPDCMCDPPQGADGWRCGAYPCAATERLVSTTCKPWGCGSTIGVKEQECVQDAACCTEFQDTYFCGTGDPAPDCPIGERIIQKICGQDKVKYNCRPDVSDLSMDGSPSCLPKCIGEYSPNEAAAIANPSLPVICPGDDLSLDKESGPWVRNQYGVGKMVKILGQGVGVCRHPPSPLPDEKCETYCLSGYLPNPNGLTCDPIACQAPPTLIKTAIAREELPEGAIRTYSFSIPNTCPMVNANSSVTFSITLKEASIRFWNFASSAWDSPITSGDNNNLFLSFKLFPLGADSQYFDNAVIRWTVSQAPGDQDTYGVSIMALECDTPPTPLNLVVQNPGEELTGDNPVIRPFNIPDQCILIDESSYFSVSVQLINATLQVYDTNTDSWSEIATSGSNNRQSLVLKYHPMGLENRFFRGNQIAWKISKANGASGAYSAGIIVDDCYMSLCSGRSTSSWVNVASPTGSCSSICSSIGMHPGISPEGMSCASGENRPMSGTGTISYPHKCAGGLGCNGNITGPLSTHFSDVYCYRNGQTEDGQPTDMTVACYCQE